MHRLLQPLSTMAFARVRVGRCLGVGIDLHWTMLVASVVWFFLRARLYSSLVWPIAEFLSLYLLVFLHEFGHALAARALRLQPTEIILWPLGGFARTQMSAIWWPNMLVAGSGPLINLLLLPVIAGAAAVFPPSDNARYFFTWLHVANGLLLLSNLLPIWPLDGGQILYFLLTHAFGKFRGTLISSLSAIVLSGLLIAVLVLLGDWMSAALALAIPFLNQSRFAWSLYWLMYERRNGLHPLAKCPQCRAHAPNGPTGACAHCGASCNLFDGPCWNCKATDLVACQHCGARSAPAAWLASPLAAVSTAER